MVIDMLLMIVAIISILVATAALDPDPDDWI